MADHRTVRGLDPELWHYLRVLSVHDRRLISEVLNEIIALWIISNAHGVRGAREAAEEYLNRNST